MPPRSNKSRRQMTITYDLRSASARDAFEQELDLEDEQQQQRRAAPGRANRGGRIAFSLSADRPPPLHEGSYELHEYATPKATTDMINLLELFGSASLDRDVIESVYLGSNSNFELAMERLMELAATAGGSSATPAASTGGTGGAADATQVASGAASSAADAGGARQPHTAGSGDAASDIQQLDAAAGEAAPGATSPAAPADICYWELLPDDLKRHVFSFFSSRDLARIARTCRGFAAPARSVRTNTRQLHIPAGLGMHGIMAMVGGHPNARAVSLRQWAHSPLSDADFTALVVALSAGSRSERRALPVEALSFKGCRWLSDGHVMALCHTMQHLKEVDLTDCVGITDAALLALAKYQRLASQGDDSASSDGGDDARDGDGAATLAGELKPAGADSAIQPLPPRRDPAARSKTGSYGDDDDYGEGKCVEDGNSDDGGDDELQFECDVAPASSPRGGASAAGSAVQQVGAPMVSSGAAGGRDGPAADSSSSSGLDGDDDDDNDDHDGAPLDEEDPHAAATWGREGRGGGGAGRCGEGAAGAASPSPSPSPASALASAFAADLKLAASADSNAAGRGTAAATAVAVKSGSGRPLTPQSAASGIDGRDRQHGGGGGDSTASTPLYGSSPTGGGVGLMSTSYGTTGSYGAARGAASPWLYGTSPSAAVGTPSAMVGSGPKSWLYGSSPVMGPSPFFRLRGSASITHNGWLAKAASTATHHHSGRGLLSINLSGCTAISSDGVRALLSAPLPKACLLQLDISRCPRITRAALALPATSNLCVLRASGCHNLHEVILQLPLTSPLTELHLSDCKALTKLHVVAPALQQLHVGSCRHLTRLHLRCPQLRHLTASLCFRLAALDPERWEVGRLEHLNLFGCRHLEWPGLAALLNRCGASLRHLDINGCNAIVVADIPGGADALRHLDASGCKSLMALRCSSPVLATATLRSCPRLQELALESPALASLDISNCPHLQLLSLPALQQLRQQLQELQGLPAAAQPPASPPPPTTSARSTAVTGEGTGGERVGALRASEGTAAAGGSGGGGGGITVRSTGCESLPTEVVVLLRRLRERAKKAAAAATRQ